MKKFLSVLTAAAAVAAVSTAAGAYDINKDLGFGWSASTTIAGSEFAEVTPDTTVTFTYTVDKSLADMEGQDYWCIKPMINDAGWPFISTLVGAELSEGGDSYVLDVDSTSMSFTIPADQLELLQNAGMAIMGHGIELHEMTFSDEPITVPAADDSTDTGAVVTAPVADDKTNPDTGVEGAAAVAGLAVIAAGAMIISRRK